MKNVLVLLCLCCWSKLFSQVADSGLLRQYRPAEPDTKTELFTNGFVDVLNNGYTNASARIFRLYVGQPGRFALPLSLYTGVAANNFNPSLFRSNDELILQLINPLSGILNISVEGRSSGKKNSSLTRIGGQYQGGSKLLSAHDPSFLRTITFLHSFVNAGIFFQTGAWERNKQQEVGIFWVLLRILAATSSSTLIEILLHHSVRQPIVGFSIGTGIEINKVLNMKVFYYHYLNQEKPLSRLDIFHLSFNYSMK
ncbi:MAG TPA: hypothetical protein VM012_03400 [Flavitalea sp.]|nr:hypothetical protein [Flavitalea sp.]